MNVADLMAYDRWYAWRLDNPGRPRVRDLRMQLSLGSAAETVDAA